MKTGVYELKNGSYLGVELMEITSVPSASAFPAGEKDCCREVYQRFVSLISAYHSLSGNGACAEILWLAEAVENQSVKSRIRLFLILRQIGADRERVKAKLERVAGDFAATLLACRYGISRAPENDRILTGLLEQTDDSCLLGLLKKEKFSGSAQLANLYYYYADLIPDENTSNFTDVIAGMSQLQNCAVSLQIFPVRLTAAEETLYRNAALQYGGLERGVPYAGQMVSDPYARDPHTVYQYYVDRRNAPLFQYNLLIFGGREQAQSLAARLRSHLQSGTARCGTADLACRDLSQAGIRLEKQFFSYPWNLNSQMIRTCRNQELIQKVPLVKGAYRIANLISAEEAAAFFRLPVYEPGMAALQESRGVGGGEQFAEAVVDEKNILLGTLVTNGQKKISIGCPDKLFTRHMLIVGTPGTGKTTFSVHLLLQFARRGIPFLAIEPTKTEYRAMIDSVKNLQVFTPGNNSVSPFIVNPFLPPRGIRVEQYIPSLVSAFEAAFSMPSPLDILFLNAIRASYTRYGWKDYSMLGDPDVRPFGLYEFILIFRELLESSSYSREVKSNLQSGGLYRLMNLIQQNSNIYDNIHTIPIEDLLSAPTVLELNAIDNAEQKSLIMALLLINICVYTKHNQAGDGKLKNAILIDEAHVLLGGQGAGKEDGAGSRGTTVRALQDMIAEIRSYGTSMIIADQSPTKVSREVVANTDIKVAFRLVQGAEKELIADSTNMDENQKEELSRLRTGEAFVFHSLLDAPQLVYTEDIREKEGIRLWVEDAEIARKNTYWDTRRALLKPYPDCRFCRDCAETCDFRIRADAEYVAGAAFQKYKKSFRTAEDMKKCLYLLPKLMPQEPGRYTGEESRRLFACARIKLMRKMALEKEFSLTEKEKAFLLPHVFAETETEEVGDH